MAARDVTPKAVGSVPQPMAPPRTRASPGRQAMVRMRVWTCIMAKLQQQEGRGILGTVKH